jgi:hypothetical protein
MTPATDQGPMLAEHEALHDGEPVYGWRWDEGTGGLCLAYPFDRTPEGQTENRKSTAANMTGADQ